MPSFDVVSEIDQHELANAVDQASREISQRFDFKGVKARFEVKDSTITLHAEVEFQLKQMLEILKLKLTKRGIDIVCLEAKEPEVNLAAARQEVILRQGIAQESGKKLQRLIKDSKIKVQAAIQGDQLRVTGKNRDDLQEAIALIRKAELDRSVQFKNFRD